MGIPSNKFLLPAGCFSRTYVGKDGVARAIAYHTPSQSVAILEGDSANIWQRIFDAKGKTDAAFAYILENGCFEGDPVAEAKSILDSFLGALCDQNLLVDSSLNVNPGKYAPPPASAIRNTENPQDDVEMQVGQFMADNHIFHSLTLELTYRCNETCIHCYCPDNRKTEELTASQISALLDEFESLGGMSLLITGGEIFARRDIKVILRDLSQRNLVVSVISNLTMADDEGLEMLASLYPRSVGCSIYSADADTHDGVTRLPGSWSRSVAALRALKARGVPVLMKSPLMEHTISGWRDIEALAQDIGCDVQFDVSITPKNDGGQQPIDLRTKDAAALKELFSSRFYSLYQNGEKIVTVSEEQRKDAILCGAGATGLNVGPSGAVKACIGMMHELGKWPQQSLQEIWDESPFFAAWTSQKLIDIEKCSTCKHFSFCNRCPGSWELETGSVTRPAGYTCYLAEIWHGCSIMPTESFSS